MFVFKIFSQHKFFDFEYKYNKPSASRKNIIAK